MTTNASDFEAQPGKRRLFIAILVVAGLALMELASFAVGSFLVRKYKMYEPPVIQHSDRVKTYADYLRLRDPQLGWPFPVEFGGDFFDSSGARYCAAFRDPAKSPNRVALFGDSYAAGSEVDDEHAWGNQLALRIGSRVGIFGVPGYGTDQAYLRYLSMKSDPSKVVVLTHLSEDIVRNIMRDWDLYTHLGYYGLKPRFTLDANGVLTLVPLPQLTEQEYRRSVGLESPFLPMEHESFQPGGPTGVTTLAFPYTVSLLRNMASYQVRALLARRPDYAEFYTKGHPLAAMEITAKILESFQDEARRRGQYPLVVLLATRHDIAYVRRTGKWTYAPLAEELRRAHVNFIDFGPTLLKHMGERPVTEFFKPLGHYNEDVSKVLADTVYETLKSQGQLAN